MPEVSGRNTSSTAFVRHRAWGDSARDSTVVRAEEYSVHFSEMLSQGREVAVEGAPGTLVPQPPLTKPAGARPAAARPALGIRTGSISTYGEVHHQTLACLLKQRLRAGRCDASMIQRLSLHAPEVGVVEQ